MLSKFRFSPPTLLSSPVGCSQLSCGFEHPAARGRSGGRPSAQTPAGQARSHERLYSRNVPVSRTQILLAHIKPLHVEPITVRKKTNVIMNKKIINK